MERLFNDNPQPESGSGQKGAGIIRLFYRRGLPAAASNLGLVYGESDEIGATVGANKVHVHDFHATILYLRGLNHE